MKTCPGCKQNKPLSDYHRHHRSGTQSRCKACVKIADAIRWKSLDGTTVEARRVIARRNYSKNGHKYRAAQHEKKYGITLEQRQAIFEEQQGLCAACSSPLTFRLRKNRVALSPWRGELDHNHTTGEVRALLCLECNMALGLLNDSTVRIKLLAAYLEKFSG